MHQVINIWSNCAPMNEPINDSINETMNDSMHGSVNEPENESMHEAMNESVKQQMNMYGPVNANARKPESRSARLGIASGLKLGPPLSYAAR